MSWTRLTSISVTNGSAIVTVNSGSTINIKVGDALLIGGFDLVEIEGVFANQLQLGSNWNHATQSNVAAAIVPTFGDFNHAVEEIRKLRQATTDNLEAMEQWWTKPEGSVVFQSYDGQQFEARSVQQMEKDVSELEAETRELMGELAAVGYFQTESVHKAIRERNKLRFAASDFVYHGKHHDNGIDIFPINEGMYSFVQASNQIFLGRNNSTSVKTGNSKTDYPVFNVAGTLVPLLNINTDNQVSPANVTMLLPPAPDGTVTNDSITGVTTDYTKEAGHYAGVTGYETAAERALLSGLSQRNESVCSAFEGILRNGDFRFGEAFWTFSSGATVTVNDGYVNYVTDGNNFRTSNRAIDAPAISDVFDVEFEITVNAVADDSESLFVGLAVGPTSSSGGAFVLTNLAELTIGERTVIRGQVKINNIAQKYMAVHGTMAAGTDFDIHKVMIKKTTTEVVTKRVDMVGIEFYDEEVTNGELFPHCIQNTDSSVIAGVPMRLSTRPKSYFQTYTGQYADGTVNDEFYCWAWEELTAIQKAKVASYLGDAAFVNSAGNIVQWRARARSFAGAGNGDWVMLDPASSNYALRSSAVICVKPQGMLNIPTTNASTGFYYSSINPPTTVTGMHGEKGLFESRITSTSYSNECYFYVIGSMSRLNQGANSPDNELGTRKWQDYGVSTNNWNLFPSSKFIGANPFLIADKVGDFGARYESGSLGTKSSGRIDGRYFDAIYPSGDGGFVDQRLKYGAWDASSSKQAAVVRKEVKNGTYRGREKLKASVPFNTSATSGSFASKKVLFDSTTDIYRDVYAKFGATQQGASDGSTASETDKRTFGYFVAKDGITTYPILGFGVDVGTRFYFTTTTAGYEEYRNDFTTPIPLVISGEVPLTVEGDFIYIDVIGHPVNALKVKLLKDGWLGGAISVIPTETINDYPYNRPVKAGTGTSGAMRRIFTVDFGDNWTEGGLTFDYENSKYMTIMPANYVALHPYVVTAKQTTSSQNATVCNGEHGLPRFIDVFSSNDNNYGAHLGYSLFNFTLKGSDPNTARQRLVLTEISLDYQEVLSSGDNGLQCQKHAPVGVLDSSNDTPACKVMMHQISKSGMASLNIVANELRFDAVSASWSDDSKMKVKNGIFTDLANASCLAVIHELSKPYGYIS